VAHTLLLADDSVTIQRVIELTFADEDVRVVAVSDGDQAIARLESAPPDIVLADIGMPGKNGYEVARYVKQTPKLAHIPVVLLTGAFEPVDQARAAEVRCDGVLAKPFEPQLVIGRVKELLTPPQSAPAHVASAAESAETLAETPAVQLDPATAELDDYFDRLDVAFAKLSANPASALLDADNALEVPQLTAVEHSDTSSSELEWEEEAKHHPESAVADQINRYALYVARPPHEDGPEAAELPQIEFHVAPQASQADAPAPVPSFAQVDSFAASELLSPFAPDQPSITGPQHPGDSARSSALSSEPPAPSSEPAGSRSEPAGSRSEPARPGSEPMSPRSEPAGHSSEPTGASVELSAPSPQPLGLVVPPSASSSQPSVPSSQPFVPGPQPSAPSPQPSAPSPDAVFSTPRALSPEPSALSPQPAALTSPFLPPPNPSLGDAFAAILAHEQHEVRPDAHPTWPLFQVPAPEPATLEITDELVERVANRVLEQMSDRLVRETVQETAASIVSSVAERLIREEIERIKASLR
jgi:CheY-like chemotaxis protein